MWFTILGVVSARHDGAEVDLGSPQQRVLFALLLSAAGRPVSLDAITAAMWDDDPPSSAANTVYRAVGSLRRALEPNLPARASGQYLLPQADGYRVEVSPETFDLLTFRELAARGQVEAYAEALALWRNDVAEGVPPQLRTHPAFTALDAEHRLVAIEAADTALAAGAAADVLPGVRRAASGAPFDEPLQARLVRLLAATGRQADALAAFDAVAERLAEELGLDPGPELVAARDAVLVRPQAATAPPEPDHNRPSPAQLPAGLPSFAARGQGLAGAAQMITQRAGGPAIAVVSGIAGVGKSTFAVQLAHRIETRFPDGALHLNLRGFDPGGRVMTVTEALHALLISLGVTPAEMPSGEDALGALLRTRTAGRRLLIVLDNARDSTQVRPLLPAAEGCAVIVTSRDQLADLVVTHGALPVPLGPLVYGEARELLTRRLGPARVTGEPAAIDEIVRYCAGLPLALAVVAARAALYPQFPLSAIATELRAADGTLDGFAGADAMTDVRSVFSWSYRSLGDPAARLFRLLGVHPGPDFSAAAAASTAAVTVVKATVLLRELVRANLVAERAPGRFEIHDLLRVYAAELGGTDTDDARRRMLDHYAVTAYHGQELIAPTRNAYLQVTPAAGVRAEKLGDLVAANDWFDAERTVLQATVNVAARYGLDEHAFTISFSMSPYLERRGYAGVGATIAQDAIDAAERLGDRTLAARALHWQAGIAMREGDLAAAEEATQRVLTILEELGDRRQLVGPYHGLGWIFQAQGRYTEAIAAFEHELRLGRELGEDFTECMALNGVAYCLVLAGEYQKAVAPAEQAMEIALRLGQAYQVGATADTLGFVRYHVGDWAAAADSYELALENFALAGGRRVAPEILDHLADSRLKLGDPAAARSAWESALTYGDVLSDDLAATVRSKLEALPL